VPESASILVVENEQKTADTVRLYLERAGFAVTVCHDGDEGLALAETGRFDLVVLDLMLPGRHGLDVCRALRAAGSPARIIMLTARTTEDDRVRGLDLGADDYVAKPFSPRELVSRVRAVLRRDQPGGPRLARGPLVLDPDRGGVEVQGRFVALTATELGILETLMSAPGRAFTRAQLIERARGEDADALERTVDAHVGNLRKKIEADRANPRFILTAFGVGYRFNHEIDAS
jgi:DNA-binding response OmpR family regulator